MVPFIIDIVSYAAGLFESLIAIYLMRTLLGAKYRWKPVFPIAASIEFILIIFLKSIYPDIMYTIIFYVVYFLLFSVLFCNGKVIRKMFVVIICISILILSDITSMMLIRLILNIDVNAQLDRENWYNLLGTVISKTICFSAYTVIIRTSKRGDEKLGFQNWLPLLAVPTVSIFSLLLIIEYIQMMDSKAINPPLVLIATVGNFSLNILVFFLYERLQESMKEKQQLSLMKQQASLQSKHYAEIESTHASIRAIWHDMNNHMTVLTNFVENGDLARVRTYLEEIGKTIHGLVLPNRTGNQVLDAVINEKYRRAKDLGIEMEFNLQRINDSSIAKMDLCIIVGNALDNAIEACQRVEKNPFIRVRIEQVAENLSIVIHNNVPPDAKENKELKTTKSDKASHGFGIGNIKKALEKHDGSFDLGMEDGIFKFSAVIPFFQ